MQSKLKAIWGGLGAGDELLTSEGFEGESRLELTFNASVQLPTYHRGLELNHKGQYVASKLWMGHGSCMDIDSIASLLTGDPPGMYLLLRAISS